MSHFNAGLISAYNSLTDKHLAGYFSNTRIRRHLQRAGLITRSGRIVSDKEYRHKLIQRAHQRHVRECLAQAIFHKVLEMERLHQIEIKRKLEEFARRERVRKIKVERSKRYEEGFVHILSPRPPTGARGIWKQHSGPEGEHSESSESPSSSRPNTAPGKMQRPVRLKPIHSNSTTASVRPLESSHENDVPFNCTMEKEPRRRLTPVEPSHGISPYCLPVINNFVTPVPPATKRKERGLKVTPSSTVRGRRLHLTTASSGADDTPVLRSSVHQSRVCVNMVYFGKTVRLSSDLTDMRDEVKVFQQHCGGENLCVYKGKLHEGGTFQFISRRHRGFPFSLTFFLNGLQVERLSSCCEFKHRKGSRLGGKHGHFGFSSVEGAAPCYKCIIAMGLDKKPTPPPKRVKEDIKREESVISPKNVPAIETERTGEDAGSHSECETSQPQETPIEEETKEDKDRDDYEEDFEADEERPAEEEKEEKSPSPSSEMESQLKEKDASDTENDEKDDDTRSHSGSSSSGSERDESDAEDTKDSKEDQKAEQPREDGQEETVAQPMEKDEPNPEEATATEAESSVAKDSHMDSAGNSTEIEISDTSVPSGSDTRQSDDKDAEKMIEESKHEEEQERAKSVQEKLAEAILKEAQCSSEPELSDTSTEEEEETTHKGPQQDNKDAAPDELVTITEQRETIAEETKCEESDTGEVVVAQEQENSPETKEQSDDEQEPHENRDSTEDENAEEDEDTADKDKSEETGEALHLLKEENVAQYDKTTEPVEETPAETIDAETVEKDEEKEEKTAVATDIQCDETGQGAKSREKDESSVSEPDEKTDETAVPDNAGAETMTARETIAIKAESSEEREALSYEEAPVTDAEKREPADSEDGAAASETEVTVENSSSSPNGSGETTVEKVADTSEENTKDESSKDDIKEEQVSGKETSKDDSQEEQCEQGEEGMETSEEKEDKQKSEEDGEEEKEKQTRATSDEVEEDESTKKRENDEKEKDIQENTAANADNATETKENEEETVKILGEEDNVLDEEKVEESEKTENDETSECVENEQEDLEAREADENEGEDETETKTAVQEHSHEAEKSESENENKAEKSEDKESKNDEEDDKEKDVTESLPGEGISATAEETEKSADVGVNETADGTKSTEETSEFESVEQEAGRASNTSEKGEIDAENGEVSTGAQNKNHDDEGEAQPKDENYLKTTEHGEEESKSDRPAEDESADIKELTMESEESAKKHEDDEADQAPGADEVERDAKEGGDSVEKNYESTPSNSQPETAGAEIKEELKLDDSEETEQDQNGNKSDCGNENKEPDFIKKESSIEGNMDEVAAVSSGNQEQSSAPVAVDLSDTASKLDEENKDAKPDIHPHTENAVGVDLPATDGENGVDTEDASKASEEGASVLLKPQAQNDEADNTEQSAAAGQGNPETLGTEDNTDLVTNWVNKHQSSKFFETFVEPLEDLREEVAETPASNSNKEETKSTELPRSESPLKMMRMSEDEEKVHTDIENVPQVEEKTDMKGLIPKAETEQSEESAALQEMRSEEHKGSKGDVGSPQECNDQKSAKQGINEETTFSKTEVESISGSHHLATAEPESVSKNQTDEKTTDNDLNVKQPQTEEGHQSTSPLGTEDINETWGKADKQDREVTETTDFTTSKSDDGSQEELRNEGVEGKASDRSIGSDRKELQLIEDIKHTLSKDQLSTFSVDETLLAHSSYPLLTATRAENGH